MTAGTVFMFSGQGSQYFQMGRALYDHNQTFRDWMLRLDAIARRVAGTSVVGTLYDDARRKGDAFDRTLLTHPAIFMVEYSLAQALMDAGVLPDIVLGVSLGSFAAAAVAGFLDVDDALNAVIGQAVAFEECGEPGGMTAVLASPALFDENFLCGCSELAAINFSSHFVVSARRTELAEIDAELKKRGVVYQRLPVSFPFHSRWIEGAKARFEPFMRSIRFRKGRLPLVCSDQAAVLPELTEDYFWDIVRHPMRFREAAARLEQHGSRRYVDLGPSGTLATFLKYGMPTTSASTVHAILTPFGGDQKSFAATVSALVGH